ncbi:hypothetical protein BIY29_02365 [Brenneria alni]|uniref:Mu-like prophage FluMu N-terminal domain-containing protein n=1 Tax=Brenneria alni TaxID=71656 RepID=A0A421DSV3_9GAMM|nr:hypothetical protein [Brenneria alni]RLM27503.1 hypothetical protein BIY29_02365 [Brenneria alni]
MSGAKNKAASQQKATDSTVQVTAPEVASLTESNGDGHESTVIQSGFDVVPGEESIGPGSDVEALLVQAVSKNGFYRCGRFWPFDGVHVFVSDDPDGDNAESEADDGTPIQPFISAATAERLKAEPQLRVTVIQTVTDEIQGE